MLVRLRRLRPNNPAIRFLIAKLRAARWFLGVLCVVLCASGEAFASEPPDALPTFEELIAPSPRSHDQSVALMEAWVNAHPSDPRAARGLIWIAQLHVADHQRELGRAFFLRAYRDYPGTEWALHGLKGLADLDLEGRHYGAAIAKFDQLARSRDPFFHYVGSMAAQSARATRLRVALAVSMVAAFVLLWGVQLWRLRSWRLLWPPPTEVAYLMPLFLLMAAVAFGQEVDEGRAVRWLALCALVMLWLNGAYLRARPPAGAWRIVYGVLGLVQAGGLLYVVIIASGLWEKFYDTLVMGAE